MAGTVGIAKSSVSREFVAQSRRVLEALAARRWDGMDFLAVYLDGIVVSEHHILAAVGVDAGGVVAVGVTVGGLGVVFAPALFVIVAVGIADLQIRHRPAAARGKARSQIEGGRSDKCTQSLFHHRQLLRMGL
jgi:hypothetical protein